MILAYFLIFISLSNSYKIIDLEPYRYTYYMNDLEKTEDYVVIYKFEPQSDKRNIFISFLGNSTRVDFDFYLYSDLSDIKYSDDKSFTNYLEKYENFGETQIKNQKLDIFYILVKMNSNDKDNEIYNYLCFMMYNLEEYLDISKYNEYILGFEGSKEITLKYPAKNTYRFFSIKVKGKCEELSYLFYENNNTEPNEDKSKTSKCSYVNNYKGVFIENNNYYIKLSFINYNKMMRILINILDKSSDIIEVKDPEADIKYGYLSFTSRLLYAPYYKYFFINIENVSIETLSYSIFEPCNPIEYSFSYKFYEHFNISELPNAYNIRGYDYEIDLYFDMEEQPMRFIYENPGNAKGLLLRIKSLLYNDNDENFYNEMIIYLHPKKFFTLTENTILNYTQLLKKMFLFLSYQK